MTADSSFDPRLLQALAEPFRKQGESVLYVAECCGKIYVGTRPPTACRTCGNLPKFHEYFLTNQIEEK